MKILVIIVSYNFEPWIDRCLGNLRRSELKADVLVVDNASQDHTTSIIESQYPEVSLIKSPSNLGFGAANNIGMKLALNEGYDAVFLLNQDAWVDEKTLGTLAETMRKHSNYGILSPVHLTGSGQELERGFAGYTGLASMHELSAKEQELVQTKFVNAAFWMIPASVLRIVGGFCPLFYHYGEDVDFVNRLTFHGYAVGYCPTVFGCHDREFRTVSHEAWMRSEAIYHLTEYANINHPFLRALTLSVAAVLKKSLKALLKVNRSTASTYTSIALKLLMRTSEVRRYRHKNQEQNANYL